MTSIDATFASPKEDVVETRRRTSYLGRRQAKDLGISLCFGVQGRSNRGVERRLGSVTSIWADVVHGWLDPIGGGSQLSYRDRLLHHHGEDVAYADGTAGARTGAPVLPEEAFQLGPGSADRTRATGAEPQSADVVDRRPWRDRQPHQPRLDLVDHHIGERAQLVLGAHAGGLPGAVRRW